MDNKICFLFGHATTPYEKQAKIEFAVEKHYHQYGIRTFIVGCRGNFDRLAAGAIKSLKRRYGDISLLLLLAVPPIRTARTLAGGLRQCSLSSHRGRP